MRDDAAMLVARVIVEAHINTWGHVPHPDFLKDAIAANIRKCAGSDGQWPERDASSLRLQAAGIA